MVHVVLNAESDRRQHQCFYAEIMGHPLDVYKAPETTQLVTRPPSLS